MEICSTRTNVMCVGLLPNLTLFLREHRGPQHLHGAQRGGGVERRSINNVGTPLGGCLLSEIKAVIPHSAPAQPPSSRPSGEKEQGDALKPRQMSQQSYLANKAS